MTLFELALADTAEYLTMLDVPKYVRYNLIKKVLVDTNSQWIREELGAKMHLALSLPKPARPTHPPGTSQLFHVCLHIVQAAGNPGDKLIKIQKAFDTSGIYPSHSNSPGTIDPSKIVRAEIEEIGPNEPVPAGGPIRISIEDIELDDKTEPDFAP